MIEFKLPNEEQKQIVNEFAEHITHTLEALMKLPPTAVTQHIAIKLQECMYMFQGEVMNQPQQANDADGVTACID